MAEGQWNGVVWIDICGDAKSAVAAAAFREENGNALLVARLVRERES